MRPEGRGELDSLYFDYPHFDPPDRAALSSRMKVAIVGAGPIGMIAALTLARYGVGSTLIEARSTFNDGSRALCISRSSFNTLQVLGVVAPFVRHAVPYLSGRCFFRGTEFLQFHMDDPKDEKYRPMYNLQQQYIEKYLHDAVAANPLIDMRWQTACTRVADCPDGVTLTLEDSEGAYAVRADWVLAADGARSTLRKLRGLRLNGDNYEGRYVIADIKMRHPIPVERIALFDPDRRPGSTVLVHQQPDDIWRIDYQLRDGEREEDALREGAIRAAVAAVLDECGYDAPWELEWWSIYSANTLALDDYRDGRVFFIGDSAHIVPIFGVRGFNNGVLDANNLGWKLAAVLNGQAAPALLDSYTPERRGATLDVFAQSSKSAQFMTPRSRGFRVMRDAALSLALDFEFAGKFANPRNMVPYGYRDSALTVADTESWAGGPGPGDAAPNVRLDDGFLLDRCGPGFTVLCFGDGIGGTIPDDVAMVVLPADGVVAKAYAAGPGSVYLIRPDLFVAARWQAGDAAVVTAQIATILSGGR